MTAPAPFTDAEVAQAARSAVNTSGGWMTLNGVRYWAVFTPKGEGWTLQVQDYTSEKVLGSYEVTMSVTRQEN